MIRCPKGGPAEMVASLLDSKLRDHLTVRNNLFTEAGHLGSSFQRPLLCIFDRNFELAAGVQHVWSYRSMVHMKLNRVVQSGKAYELDDIDSFWVSNSSAPFPKIAELVEAQLNKYKQDVDAVNRRAENSSSRSRHKATKKERSERNKACDLVITLNVICKIQTHNLISKTLEP